MNVLLDTQVFLWLINDADELSKVAKKIFLDQKNNLYLSLASIWEIAIKASLKKLTLSQDLEKLIPEQLQINNITQLDINFCHVVKVSNLPFYHRDPFDRLLIAQAMEEDFLLLSNDKAFDHYKIKRVW